MSNPQAKQADFSALKALWNHADRLDAAGFEVHAENSTPYSVESYSAAVFLSSVSRPFLAGQEPGRTLSGTKSSPKGGRAAYLITTSLVPCGKFQATYC